MIPIKFVLSHKQLQKLHSHSPVQLKHEQIGHGEHILHVKKRQATKIMKAHQLGKGCRIQLDGDEYEESVAHGGAFLDFLKNTGQFLKDKVFSNPTYQQNIAPLIRRGLNAAVDRFVPGITAPTGFAPELTNLARAGVNKLGDVTHAYGLYPTDPVILSDFSKPDREIASNAMHHHVKGGKLQKGSAAAKEWGRQMQMRKKSCGGSFKMAGS